MSLMSSLMRLVKSEAEEQSSSETAKQRLRILLINDRAGINSPDFLPQLNDEILAVLRKYIPQATQENVEVKYANTNEAHIIEMSVSLDADEYRDLQLSDVKPADENKQQ